MVGGLATRPPYFSGVALERQFSVVSSTGGGDDVEDLELLHGDKERDAQPPLEWELLSARSYVEVDLRREAVRGQVELHVQLPTSPPLMALRLNCGGGCEVQQITLHGRTLDGATVTAYTDAVVPTRWRYTRDLASFRSCHGAALATDHEGELEVPLPHKLMNDLAADKARLKLMNDLTADKSRLGDPSSSQKVEVTVLLQYRASGPFLGLHFARPNADGEVKYVHSIALEGAVRRWMPCVERVDVRCPYELHLSVPTDDEDAAAVPMVAFGSGLPFEAAADAGPRWWRKKVSSAASAGSAGNTLPRVWSFKIETPVLASQVGFILGRSDYLSACPHPTLPRVTLVLGILGDDDGTDGKHADVAGGRGLASADGRSSVPTDGGPPLNSESQAERRRRHRGIPREVALRRWWPQLLYVGRLLPPLLNFLRDLLLAPCKALLQEEAVASAASTATSNAHAAASRAAASSTDPAAAAAAADPSAAAKSADVRGQPSGADVPGFDAAFSRGGGAALTPRSAATLTPRSTAAHPSRAAIHVPYPFPTQVVAALEGPHALTSAFFGLLLLSTDALHPPEAIEPARPLRVALARALGRSWIEVGMWLRSWHELWLQMAAEGWLVRAYIAHAFGQNEALHFLAAERAALCDTAAVESLVPTDDELREWGGQLHAEQLRSEYRLRKAPWVLRMMERQLLRSEHGEKTFERLMAHLVLFPPRAHPDRLDCTDALLRRCQKACGLDLAAFAQHWIYEARPCPTVAANFAYSKRRFLAELVVVTPPLSAPDAHLTSSLCVGWGEADTNEGALPQHKHFNLTERPQLLEIEVDARRRRRRKRLRAEGEDVGPGEEDERVVVGSNVPLLWLRIDPHLDWALRVRWTGRPDAPKWSGQPEFMCREQLEHDRDVVSQEDAARALSTFGTHSAIEALMWSVYDPSVYFRVRTAALRSLGELVQPGTDYVAMQKLVRYFREQYCKGTQVLPNDFSDFSRYHVLKALLEAIGCARDAQGRTMPEAFSLLVDALDDNDNSSNEFDDGYYLGAILRVLASTRTSREGDAELIVAQVERHLRLDALLNSHQRVLTRCCLQALAQLELARRRDPDWKLYWYYELESEYAAVRLAAADCMLRVALMLQDDGATDAAFRARAIHGGRDDKPAMRRSVLALALQFSDEREHAPLERLQLWQTVLTALRPPPVAPTNALAKRHRAAVDLQRELLSDRESEAAQAVVQLLWYLMTVGSANDLRLRFTLCEVWREVFADQAPQCVPFKAQQIGHAQTLPQYTPQYVLAAQDDAVKRAQQAREEKEALAGDMKHKFRQGVSGAYTHSRHSACKTTAAASSSAPLKLYSRVDWRLAGAVDPRVQQAITQVQEYSRRVESRLEYRNLAVVVAPPPLPPEERSHDGAP